MGAIGKSSFAEEVQNSFHALINNKAQNWTFQVGDRFYFNIEVGKYKKIAEGVPLVFDLKAGVVLRYKRK